MLIKVTTFPITQSITRSQHSPAQSQHSTSTAPAQYRRRKEGKKGRREEGKKESGPNLFGSALVVSDKPKGPDFEAMFRQWYAVYPKKVDPKDAMKSFIRVLKAKEATFHQLLDGAKRYEDETRAAGTIKKYIKAPAVWLNKGSWANESGGHQERQPALPPRAGTAIAGIMSRLSEEDFSGGNS
jgi:hypothetical protein